MIIAHRGFSGRQPEMTVAAYLEAIAWSRETGIPLGLECDVSFSADDELICLHDLTVDRTSTSSGRALDLTVAELKAVDFGSRWIPPTKTEQCGGFDGDYAVKPSTLLRTSPAGDSALLNREQCELITLRELMTLTRDARRSGVDVSLVVETKHPNGRGMDVERRLAAMLGEFGWDRPGSPVAVITFSLKAVKRLGTLLPALPRTLLIEKDLGKWRKGRLPDGVRVVGPDLELIRQDPGFVRRAVRRGNEVHVWTVNDPADIGFCRGLGVTGFTTDFPDRVAEVLGLAGDKKKRSQ